MPKDDPIAAQLEVQRQFGRCLLRLQAYELGLKRLIAGANLRHRSTGPGQIEAVIPEDLQRKSLGMLAGDLMTSFFTGGEPFDDPLPDEEEPDEIAISFRVRIPLPEGDFQRTKADIGELVTVRNDLVHHFLEAHDLTTVAGCLKAQATLARALDRVAVASAALASLCRVLQEAQGEMAAYISSPKGQALFIHNRLPWHRLPVTQALTEAAEACQTDGWASLADAVAWMKAHHPSEDPSAYGCKSWPQVIHETGLFELRHLTREGKRQRFYRVRGES